MHALLPEEVAAILDIAERWGPRTVLDAVFGTLSVGETNYAPKLLGCLHQGMLLLADRNFAAAELIEQVAATGADLTVPLQNQPPMPVIGHCGDGSWLSRIGTTVRVIDAQVVVRLAGGPPRTECYLLITTLTDHR